MTANQKPLGCLKNKPYAPRLTAEDVLGKLNRVAEDLPLYDANVGLVLIYVSKDEHQTITNVKTERLAKVLDQTLQTAREREAASA